MIEGLRDWLSVIISAMCFENSDIPLYKQTQILLFFASFTH